MTRLAAPAGGRGDRFGAALAADDREVWVGAPGAGGPGRVFVFPGSATGFQIDGLRLLGPSWTDPAAAGVVDLDARQRRRRRRHGREPRRRRPLHLRARRVRRLARAADDDDAARRAAGDHRRRAPLQQQPARSRCSIAAPRTCCRSCRRRKLTHDGHYIAAVAASGAGPIAQTKQEWALRRPPRRHDVRRHHQSDAAARRSPICR